MSVALIEEIIQKDFIKFLSSKERQISKRTIERYISDIYFYIDNFIKPSAIIDSFDNFFTPNLIRRFLETRKSSTARATLYNFITFLREFEKIKDVKYLELLEFLKELKKTRLEKSMEFLGSDELSFLLGGSINYKQDEMEASIVLPLILSLSYDLLFEQDHLIKLKWSDIELENNRIRNLRSEVNDMACKWIKMSDRLRSLIVSYKTHCAPYKPEDNFIIFRYKPLDNTSINSLLGILKRVKNRKYLPSSVDIQKLHRSRILKELMDTDGKAAIDFITIYGLSRDTQLQHALQEYLLNINSKMSFDF